MSSNSFSIFTSGAMQSNSWDIWQFLFYSKKMTKIGPKNWLFGSLWEVFCLHPLMPYELHQMKGLMKTYNCGKFHLYSICFSQVINFQMFLWCCSIHEMDPFREVLGPFSSKYSPIWLKFWPVVDKDKDMTKTLCEQSFEIMCLRGNRKSLRLQFWSIFWPNLPPENVKDSEKPNFF